MYILFDSEQLSAVNYRPNKDQLSLHEIHTHTQGHSGLPSGILVLFAILGELGETVIPSVWWLTQTNIKMSTIGISRVYKVALARPTVLPPDELPPYSFINVKNFVEDFPTHHRRQRG